MKFLNVATLAATIASVAAQTGSDWVTYTKNLASTTVTVTRYLGTSALSGTDYTTRTIVVSDASGNPQYTETVVGAADSTSAAPTTTSTSEAGWVTYTKNLGTATIVVTRYLGTSALSGSDYTTKTVVVSDASGNPQYTETVVAAAETTSAPATTTSEAGWVTYTKNLGTATIVVTRYLGTSALSGTDYTTKTIVVSDASGNPQYTETVVAAADTTSAPATTTSEAGWVTYTKDLGTATIVVTRYLGTSALSGTDYTTRTIVVSDASGNPQYTETIVGAAATTTAAPESSAEETTGDGWVTYTKDLGSRTIVVTRYRGSSTLTGSDYTTRTIVVSDASGNPQYTEVIVGSVEETTAPETTAAPETTTGDGWVTYTKNLGSTTIVVTRYRGSSSLTGDDYTTRTIVVSDASGNPQYTEVIVGLASSTPSASSSVAEETSASATPSQSSEAAASSTSFPGSFEGSFNGGAPKWTLAFPGTMGPWSSISISFSQGEAAGSFKYSAATAAIDGEESTEATISVADDTVTIEADFAIDTNQEVVFEIDAEILSGSAWAANAHIVLTTADGKKFVKRAEQTWDLSSTITEDASSSEAASSGAAASSEAAASSSGAVASSDAAASSSEAAVSSGAALSTSTEVVDEQSTTVITVTSCSDDACSTTAVTTGVTVVTTTSEGVVTEYTTYCPLTTESEAATSTKAPSAGTTTEAAVESTTLVTITSCAEGVCTTQTSVSTKAAEGTTVASQGDETSTQTVQVTSTEGVISTFAGAAGSVGVSVGALVLAAAALF